MREILSKEEKTGVSQERERLNKRLLSESIIWSVIKSVRIVRLEGKIIAVFDNDQNNKNNKSREKMYGKMHDWGKVAS